MENTCNWTRKNMKKPYSIKMTLSDENGKDFVLEVSEG
jgi:hypothetical protein